MSFILIKNKSGPNLPKLSQGDVCPFGTTRCCGKRKKSFIKFQSFPFITCVCNLHIKSSHQTLSKALEMPKKVPLTSRGGLQSNDL